MICWSRRKSQPRLLRTCVLMICALHSRIQSTPLPVNTWFCFINIQILFDILNRLHPRWRQLLYLNASIIRANEIFFGISRFFLCILLLSFLTFFSTYWVYIINWTASLWSQLRLQPAPSHLAKGEFFATRKTKRSDLFVVLRLALCFENGYGEGRRDGELHQPGGGFVGGAPPAAAAEADARAVPTRRLQRGPAPPQGGRAARGALALLWGETVDPLSSSPRLVRLCCDCLLLLQMLCAWVLKTERWCLSICWSLFVWLFRVLSFESEFYFIVRIQFLVTCFCKPSACRRYCVKNDAADWVIELPSWFWVPSLDYCF